MERKTEILVFPFPAQGHINPILQFSKRLASEGHTVTLLTTTSVSKSMHVKSGSVNIESIHDGFDEGELAENIQAHLEHFIAVVSQNLSQFIEQKRSSGCPPVVLVYDAIMPWCLDVAKEAGIKAAAFFTQMCAVCAIYYHQHQGNLDLNFTESSGTFSMPSLPVMKIGDLPSLIPDRALYPAFFSVMVNQFSNFQKAHWLLFNTFDKLEEEVLNWMARQWPIMTVGPTVPSMCLDKRLKDDKDYGLNLFQPSAEACMKWLDTKEKASVVYASFGSLASVGQEQMEELAWGLKNSNNYFLWIVRASEESKLPSGFMSNTSEEKGLVVNWCPQLDVLAHQAVGCFMTHCGWNSTLEALSLGVPMVAMPQWTDQTTNAKYIVDVWQTGVRVKVNNMGIITREEVELCIKEVTEGEKGDELRRNAIKWKEFAKEAVDIGGSSDKNIDDFISKIVCS